MIRKRSLFNSIVILCMVFILFEIYFNSQDQNVMNEENLYKNKLTTNSNRDAFVTVVQGGRLGNQIWEYISVWLVAQLTGLKPYVPKNLKLALSHMFDNLTIPTSDEIEQGPKKLQHAIKIQYIENYNFSSNLNIILKKYNTQPELFGKYYKDAIKQLNIKKSLLDSSQEVLHSAANYFKKENATFIGVHIRRADYINYIKRRVTPATITFYTSAIKYMRNKYKNSIFIVVSDDPKWCAKQFKSFRDVYITQQHYKKGSPFQDLTILASCNHSIFDYGTFGSWGALFAGGETVFYYVSSDYLTGSLQKVMPNWHSV